MARYIDAEKLCKGLKEMASVQYPDKQNAILGVISTIENAPTADVVEVKHGYWKPSPNGVNPIRCSECNMPAPMASCENEFGDFVISRYPSSYCHECGAKMDGGKNENV